MILLRAVLAVLLCLSTGCAIMADKGIMEEYGSTMDTYETAMQMSDFNTICQNIDPAVMSRTQCMQRFDNLKIVSYDVFAVNVAKDQRQVDMAVEVQYFFLDRYVVKKLQFDQTWRYSEELKRWMLTEGPPEFKDN
jgi:hypothetical protein